MFITVMMALGVAGGYVVAVAISMILTFALTMSVPKFVEGDHLVRNGYKVVHEGLWLLCAATGGFVTSLVVKGIHPIVTEALLTAALIWILWDNSWEARQRGMAHQVIITAFTVLGVASGYLLQRQMM